MRKKFEDQVVDFIGTTIGFTVEEIEEVNVGEGYIEVTIMGNQFTFFNTGEVNVVLDGEYTIEDIDNIKDVMESGEEIWMMFNNCFEEVNECTINR